MSKAILIRVTKFSESILLQTIWSFSWITSFLDFLEAFIRIFLVSLLCSYFWTNLPPIGIHFLKFQAMSLSSMQLKLYFHFQYYKYWISLTSSKSLTNNILKIIRLRIYIGSTPDIKISKELRMSSSFTLCSVLFKYE